MKSVANFLQKLTKACPALPYMALGIWLIWVFVLNSGTAWLSDNETDGTNISVLYLTACGAIGAFLLLSSFLPVRLADRLFTPLWIIGGGIVSTAGCFLVIIIGPYYLYSFLEEWAVALLFRVGAFFGGVGSVPLLLKCADMYGRLTPRHAILYTAFSHIIAACTYFVVVGAPSWAPVAGGPSLAGIVAFTLFPLLAAFLACLPFVNSDLALSGEGALASACDCSDCECAEVVEPSASAAYRPVSVCSVPAPADASLRALRKKAALKAKRCRGCDRVVGTGSTTPFKKLVVVMFVFSLAIAVVRAVAVQSSPVEQTYEITRLAMLLRMAVATAFACVAVAADAKVFNFGKIYSVVMAITVAIVALLPFMDVFHAVTGSFVLLISFIFDFLLWCVLSFIVYQNRRNLLWVMGQAYGCSYLGTTAGWALGAYVVYPALVADEGSWIIWLVLAVFVLAAAFVLFSEKEFDNLFRSADESGKNLEVLLEEDVVAASSFGLQEGETGWFEGAIAMVADQCGLTEREREVLRCLAHGYNVSAVAKSLQVSRNTARNHCSSIYAKLGVHSKQEVVDKVNGLRQTLRKK